MVLEYSVTTERPGDWGLKVHLSPTLDTGALGGLRLGLSIDDRPVTIAKVDLGPTAGAANSPQQQAWVKAVIHNRHAVAVRFVGLPAGEHTVKVWRLDDNVVLEELQLLRR